MAYGHGMDAVSLTDLAEEHLQLARQHDNGRSAQALHPGRQHQLRQTMIAMVENTALGEHQAPGEATLQVLSGRVRLSTPDASAEGSGGDLLIIPAERHDLAALEDSVVLLTTIVPLKTVNLE